MAQDFSLLLRESGFRVTKPRLALLAFLAAQQRPVSLQRIAAHLRDTNITTVYRMIEALVAKGILRGCDVGHGHMDYELADLPHHHHVVCTLCGAIAEVGECVGDEALHAHTLKASKTFSRIDSHQTTFYGVCTACA